MEADVHLVDCVECGAPAVLEERGMLTSTGGPVRMVKVTCFDRHWFLGPYDAVVGGPVVVGLDARHRARR